MNKILKIVILFSWVIILGEAAGFSQTTDVRYPIIPQPVSLRSCKQEFIIEATTRIVIPNEQLREAGNALAGLLSQKTGFKINCVSKNTSHSIRFLVDPKLLNNEEYKLSVSKRKIVVEVAGEKGAFYAVQTLRQLIKPGIEPVGTSGSAVRYTIPGCKITDFPLYAYRGFHLDVSRHFFTKEYILELIDWLSFYKINKLQLHLTDDQGWRIQIDQFPLLIETGAWRTFNNLDSACMKEAVTNPDFEIDRRFIKEVNGNVVYGGFYTKDDIRQIIAYASAHYIDVIPEIDMPGHMSAAISAYPFLSCTGSRGWGKEFSYPICPCKDEVMDFCFKVWDEVSGLFPYKVVHIGSDEVEKDTWESSVVCQQFMKDHNMTEVKEIQNYYVNSIQKHLELKGKSVIAWDDVIDGKVDSNLIMMYWRDWLKDSPGKCAANRNDIILTPWSPFYISGRHTDETFAALYNYNPATSFSSEVVSKVIGIQSCVWTEEIPSEARFEYLVFPRLQALSEVCWSPQRNWESFKTRLEPHERLMDSNHIRYRKPGWEEKEQDKRTEDKR